jgi:hypothetical protein
VRYGFPDIRQGCQMAYFKTKNPNLGKFWRWRFLRWKMLVYFMAIWSILQQFGLFCGHFVYFTVILYISPVLVGCTKKNLTTLVYGRVAVGTTCLGQFRKGHGESVIA